MNHLRTQWRTAADSLQFIERSDVIALFLNGEQIGHIDWEMVKDPHVYDDDWEGEVWGDALGYYLVPGSLVVHPEHRRKGYATMLFDRFKQYAERHFGEKGWKPGQFTRDGAAFWEAYTGKRPATTRTIRDTDVTRIYSAVTAAKTYYHVSPRRFSPGDILTPGKVRGEQNIVGDEGSNEHVFMCDSLDDAWQWIGLLSWKDTPQFHTYEVQPLGSVTQRRLTSTGDITVEYQTDSAKVVRLVGTEDIDITMFGSTGYASRPDFQPTKTPQGAAGLCEYVNGTYAEEQGGEMILFAKGDTAHTVALVNGQIVDWAARQFDPQAEWPVTMEPEAYQRRFGFDRMYANNGLVAAREKRKAIIFDRDGTCSSVAWRVPLADANKWDEFFEVLDADAPVPSVVRMMNNPPSDTVVLAVSAIGEQYRRKLEIWYARHGIHYDELHMRPAYNTEPDEVVKERILDYLEQRFDIVKVVDDREKVCQMWRRRGLDVMQVTDPGLPPLMKWISG